VTRSVKETTMQRWPATLMEFWAWHVEAACGAVDISRSA
jgi:hypothetical protein